jgi:hypothetical protein
MNDQTDFTVKAESEDFKNALFLAMELSRATWLVATFAPRLGDKISVHAIPGGDTKRLLELIGRLQAKLRGKGVSKVRTVCCYEAGYDGFWLHRVLVNHGIEKSELSLWYYSRVGDLKGRVRRIMIIALARKLVIALWRYVETGKVPTGAIVAA